MNNNLLIEVGEGISRDDVSQTLERVLQSEPFLRSRRLSLFLRFAVDRSLEGRTDLLKEYTIGTEVYGRRSDFDPAHDSIVRAEARRLRKKLKEYRDREGRKDEVAIVFHAGSYVPSFERTADSAWREAEAQTNGPIKNFESDGPFVRISPFRSLGGALDTDTLASDITEELLHRMAQIAGLNVVWRPIDFAWGDIRNLKHSQRPEDVVIEGTVRSRLCQLWITIRITTLSGLLLASERFAVGAKSFDLAAVSEKVAATVLDHIPEMTVSQEDERVAHQIQVMRNRACHLPAFSPAPSLS